jgi:hypothetical protein
MRVQEEPLASLEIKWEALEVELSALLFSTS